MTGQAASPSPGHLRRTPLPASVRVRRLVVGLLVAFTMLVGAAVLGLVTFLLLFAGVPSWLVPPLLVALVVTLVLAGRRVQARVRRH